MFAVKPEKNDVLNIKRKYAVFFIGSSVKTNLWKIEKFAETAKWLKEIKNYEIVLCGGNKEKELANDFARLFNSDFINLEVLEDVY